MKQFGKVDIPQNAFLNALKMNENQSEEGGKFKIVFRLCTFIFRNIVLDSTFLEVGGRIKIMFENFVIIVGLGIGISVFFIGAGIAVAMNDSAKKYKNLEDKISALEKKVQDLKNACVAD